jgi:hypothetical protein
MLHIYCADNKGPAHEDRSPLELEANAAAIVAAMNSLPALLECAEALTWFASKAHGEHDDTEIMIRGGLVLTIRDLRRAARALEALGKVGGA